MFARSSLTASLFPLMIAGLLAGLSYWLEFASRPQSAATNGKLRHDPDYFAEQFVVRRHDKDGTLLHTLKAEQMRHYPDDDTTVIVSPNLTYHREPRSFISAREARLDKKGEYVELIEDVRVTRLGVQGKPATILTTSWLEAWPDDETANTDKPVTITQGLTNVTGTGLSLNNQSEIYVLEGPVNGVFYREQPSQPVTSNAFGTPISSMMATPERSTASVKDKPEAKALAKSKTSPRPKVAAKPKVPAKPKSRPVR